VGVEYVAEPIRTDRLLLRPFEAHDLEDVLAIYSRPDVARYLYEGPRSREQASALLERKMGGRTIRADGDTVSLAVEPIGGAMVGDCMVRLLSAEHRQGEIGFVIHPDHQGRGTRPRPGAPCCASPSGSSGPTG